MPHSYPLGAYRAVTRGLTLALCFVLLACADSAPSGGSTGDDSVDDDRRRTPNDLGSTGQDTTGDGDLGDAGSGDGGDPRDAGGDVTGADRADGASEDGRASDDPGEGADDAGDQGADGLTDLDSAGECSEKLRQIYVMDKGKSLFRFDTDGPAFVEIGEVDCDEFLDTTPGSMAVSRAGVAYVNYSNSELFEININDATCEPTGWTAGTGGFDRFGMGYVSHPISGQDVLYIANSDTLAVLDTSEWTIDEVGSLPSQSELTGNADGELWGFFPLESPPELVRLDTSDASALETYELPALPADLDTFAFSYWGGDFYVFYRIHGMGSSTEVFRYNVGTGLSAFMDDTGRNVIGAGVSTCAPTED